MTVKLLNGEGKGQVFYGLHMVPGVAEYQEPGKEAFRIFINEDAIREMGPTFAGRPIFVEHVDEVEENLTKLKTEADGWVVESFYNAADGKNWVKFIIVSELGLSAIRRGYRLSNAYIPKSFGPSGLWNGVSYQKEVTSGEYEHLAIVKNPRYEESVVMSPEEFKAYNDEKNVKLERLANSKEERGETKMKFWKREAVKNAADLEGVMVELPKSKTEISLTKLINDHDAILNMHGYANGDHLVKVGDKDEMSVNDLVKKHMEMSNELEKLKSAAGPEGGEPGKGDDDSDPAMVNDEESLKEDGSDVDGRGGDKNLNSEDEDEKKKKENEAKDEEKMKNAKAKAAALKNAHLKEATPVARVELGMDQVARGKMRYGSGN